MMNIQYTIFSVTSFFSINYNKTHKSRLRYEIKYDLYKISPKITRKLSYRKDDRTMRPIRGCPENVQESLSTPMAIFPEIFNGLSFRSILWMCVQNLKFVALPVPEIIAIEVLGGGCEPPILGKTGRGGRRGSGMVPFERALVSFHRPSIVTFHLSLRVSEILPLLCSSTPLFPTPPLVSPKFPHVPVEVGGWPLGYEERRR